MASTAANVEARKSVEVQGGGRGGAGNIGQDSGSSYVDGGLYRTESPGADGRPYSTGRGGAGNMGEGTPRPSTSGSDSRDQYASESVVPSREGETMSGGRGGAGNIGDVQSQDKISPTTHHSSPLSGPAINADDADVMHGKESNPKLEKRRLSSGMSHLGLADKMKYGILSMMKKD